MTDDVTDYDVTIVVRNGRLRAAMRQAGYFTASALCSASGLSQTIVGGYLSLTRPPYSPNGKLRPSAERLCEFFGRSIDELFPQSALTRAMVVNSVTVGMSEGQVAALIDAHAGQALLAAPTTPEQQAAQDEAAWSLKQALESLGSARLRKVISMRFGMEPYDRSYTLDETAEAIGVTRERARQIELKAISRLRHPHRIRDHNLRAAAATFDVRIPKEMPAEEA